MATKIIVGLIVIAAVVEGLWAGGIPQGILPLALVVLGIAYGFVWLDAEDATGYLAVAIAVWAASSANVLDHIHYIGTHLDSILDQVNVALLGAVVAILVIRTWNRLMPADTD